MATLDSHTYASRRNGIADTETFVRVNLDDNAEHSRVWVRVDCLPGLVRWSAPPASVILRWVDEALSGTGYAREGARIPVDLSQSWGYSYPVKRAH